MTEILKLGLKSSMGSGFWESLIKTISWSNSDIVYGVVVVIIIIGNRTNGN